MPCVSHAFAQQDSSTRRIAERAEHPRAIDEAPAAWAGSADLSAVRCARRTHHATWVHDVRQQLQGLASVAPDGVARVERWAAAGARRRRRRRHRRRRTFQAPPSVRRRGFSLQRRRIVGAALFDAGPTAGRLVQKQRRAQAWPCGTRESRVAAKARVRRSRSDRGGARRSRRTRVPNLPRRARPDAHAEHRCVPHAQRGNMTQLQISRSAGSCGCRQRLRAPIRRRSRSRR